MALAAFDLSESERAQGLEYALRAVALAGVLSDPHLGWLAHAAASRLHQRLGQHVDADFHGDEARRLAAEGPEKAPDGTVVWAKEQTDGRGRRDG